MISKKSFVIINKSNNTPTENNSMLQNTILKIYSKNVIDIITFLGGPIGGIYMIYKNYTVFGKGKTAKQFLSIGLGLVLIFLIMLLLLPDNTPKSVSFGIGLIPFFIIHSYMKKNQETNIDSYLNAGGKTFSILNSLGVFFLSIIFASR